MSEQTATRARWLILVLCCGASWMLYLHRYTYSLMIPELEKEGWSRDTLSWLATAFAFSYALGQVPGGVLCDGLGPRYFLAGTVLGWSLSLTLTALAGTVALMALARVSFGLFQAGCYPALNKMTRLWFPFRQRTTVQGLIATLFGRAGAACSTVLMATVLMGHVGLSWREALLIFSVAGVAFAFLFLVLARDNPSLHPWANEAEQRLVDEGEAISSATMTGARLDWGNALSQRTTWGLLLQLFSAALVDGLYLYWIPTFLYEARQFDVKAAGIYASLPLVGGALGGITSAMMQDALLGAGFSRRLVRSGVGLIGNMVAAVLILVAAKEQDGRWAMALLGGVKFFADWSQPSLWGAVTDVAGRTTGSVFAIVNMAGSIGSMLAPIGMSRWVSAFNKGGTDPVAGWEALFFAAAVIYLVAGLAWLLIDSGKPLNAERAERAERTESAERTGI